MRHVLIPSDTGHVASQLAAAYIRRGWEATVGVGNFSLHGAAYDLVHLQWPEEICGWKPPSAAQVEAIARDLDRWSAHAQLILTVHNLYPHGHQREPRYRSLLDACYSRIPVIAHFTETSRRLVTAEFPAAAAQRNIVTGFFNYDCLLPPHRDATAARRRFDLRDDEFVVLSFGILREWVEVELIRRAFDAAQVPRKRLLMGGSYQEFGPVWQQRWRRWNWSRWLRKSHAVSLTDYVPDDDIHRLFDAADVLVIPRLNALNSGLPALAATFGKPFIAPDNAVFPELVAGTANPLYRPGDPQSLAAAIEKVAALDRRALAAENRALADRWNWDGIVAACLSAVGLE